RIDAVLIVEIDHLYAEALEARVAGACYDFRPPVRVLSAAAAEIAELGGEEDLSAPSRDRLADQRFVVSIAISVGGIEQPDSEVERIANEVDAFAVVAGTVDIGQRHATEADRRNLRRSEPA